MKITSFPTLLTFLTYLVRTKIIKCIPEYCQGANDLKKVSYMVIQGQNMHQNNQTPQNSKKNKFFQHS